MNRLCSMREALYSDDVFGKVLEGESWAKWRVLLIAALGEPLTAEEREIFTLLTKREQEPSEPCDEFWGVCGRGAGKSRAFSIAASYYAGCVSHDGRFAPGQRGRIPVMAASKEPAKEVFNYLLGIFTESPMLSQLKTEDHTADTIRLDNQIDIMVTAASFKTVRGPTMVAAVCDEIAFWGQEAAANPDTEILRALRPGLARAGGALFVLSSPYAKRGELWTTYKKHFGQTGDPRILVAQAPTLVMHDNPALARDVAREYERDPENASAEYGAQFRSNIAGFVSNEVVERCTDSAIVERPYDAGISYSAFIDPSGGAGKDSMTLAIAHRDGDDNVILDHLSEIEPPFSPESACADFASSLLRYGVHEVTGDNFAGEWPKEMMRKFGIGYTRSEKFKGQLYSEFLPLLNSGKARLLDVPKMQRQLLNLERRTAFGGRDSIDHPPGGHDDLINVVAGALVLVQPGADGYDPKMWERLLEN